MITSEAYTINVLFALALALASDVSCNFKWLHNLEYHLGVIYNHMFIKQATG